jgi:UDP-N-acetylmuramoyl-tripeptide--D-alanyl-D-alanine ligase
MRFDEHFIKQVIPDVSIVSGVVPAYPSFSIDSRTVKPGDFFIALSGKQNDGHAFIADVIKKGVSGIMINRDKKEYFMALTDQERKKVCVMLVPDTLQALLTLASSWRALFTIPIIGITGSVGKTSTKELFASMVKAAGRSYIASEGNQNTVIGAALNILKIRSEHEVAIFELGISRRGEMKKLVAMIKPTIAVITCIGHSHMEGLGSLHDIALEKRAIFSQFTERNIGIINGDQPLLSTISYPHPIIKFGFKTTNQIQARKVRIEDGHVRFVLKLYKDKYDLCMPRPHFGAVSNALAAVSVAYLLELPIQAIMDAIQLSAPVANRFEKRKLKGVRGSMISDCYNANPESMKAALLAFEQIVTGDYKIAVLGDMLELGVNSPFWHRQIGRFLRKVPSLKRVILVGSMVEWTKKTIPIGVAVTHVATWQDAVAYVNKETKERESLVLVKGSFGMGLLNLVKECAQ